MDRDTKFSEVFRGILTDAGAKPAQRRELRQELRQQMEQVTPEQRRAHWVRVLDRNLRSNPIAIDVNPVV